MKNLSKEQKNEYVGKLTDILRQLLKNQNGERNWTVNSADPTAASSVKGFFLLDRYEGRELIKVEIVSIFADEIKIEFEDKKVRFYVDEVTENVDEAISILEEILIQGENISEKDFQNSEEFFENLDFVDPMGCLADYE